MLRIIVLPAADSDRVELTFPFDREVLNAVKLLPGRQYDRDRRRWSIPRRAVPRLGAALTGRDVRIVERVRLASPRAVRQAPEPSPTRTRRRALPGALPLADLVRLLGSLHNAKHRLIALLLYSAGVRVSELIRLRADDVQLDGGQLRIHTARCSVALSPLVSFELERYLDLYRPREWLFTGARANRPLSEWSVRKLMRAALHTAGVVRQDEYART